MIGSLYRTKRHDRTVNVVAFSPDGRLLASGDDDGRVRVRPVERLVGLTRESVRRYGLSTPGTKDRDFLDRESRILSLAFTPDGTRLIAAAIEQEAICIWRLSDGELLRRMTRTHSTRGRGWSVSPRFVAVTPDGRRIVSAGQSTVPIGQTRIPNGPAAVSISEVRSWDIETGERVLDLYDDEDMGYGNMALSPDGRRIAVADFGVIRIHDASTGRPERRIELPGSRMPPPGFSPDGTVVAMPVANALHLFDLRTGRRLIQDEGVPRGQIQSAAWSPSGDRIATGHGDGIVRVWDAATGQRIWHKLLTPVIRGTLTAGEPFFVAFSGDGRRLIAAGRRYDPITEQNGLVAIYEAASGALVREVPGQTFDSAAVAPDGRIVVLNTHQNSGTRRLLGVEPETGRERWSAPAEDQPADLAAVLGMHFRSNTPLLEAATTDGHVVRFNALTGRDLRRFRVDGRPPEERDALPDRPALKNATFSADGRTLASTAREWIYIWDVETGRLRREIRLSHEEGCYLALRRTAGRWRSGQVPTPRTRSGSSTSRPGRNGSCCDRATRDPA